MGYTHGTKWTEELIVKELFKVMKCLNISRMPTSSEIFSVAGNGLSIIIGRRGGYKCWADKMNLPIKESETNLGKNYEQYVTSLLQSRGYEVERMTTKHPYDLLANQNIKIDVKVSNLYQGGRGNFHTFNLGKHYHNCDIFICVCVTNEKIVKTLVIPSKHLMKINQLTVGIKSDYDKYNNKFFYIKKYDDFYKKL